MVVEISFELSVQMVQQNRHVVVVESIQEGEVVEAEHALPQTLRLWAAWRRLHSHHAQLRTRLVEYLYIERQLLVRLSWCATGCVKLT